MTERITIPFDDTYTLKPSWVYAHWQGDKPMICCPNGHHSVMGNHTIETDGTVNGSILCPEPDCGWHVWGILQDWKPK